MGRRLPSIWRDLESGLVPHRVLMVGPPELTLLVHDRLVRSLEPKAVHVCASSLELLTHLTNPPRQRTVELLTSDELPEATPDLLSAVRSMTRHRSQWLVMRTTAMPEDYWTHAFGDQIWNLEVTANELLWWIQKHTHLPEHEAQNLMARCMGDNTAILNAVRQLQLMGGTTGRDLDVLLTDDPEQAFTQALLHGQYRDALRQAELVTDTDAVLRTLFEALILMWAAAELRPSARTRPRKEVSELLGITPEQVDEIVPHVRRYSRTKVHNRLEALALVREHAGEGLPRRALLEVLVEIWR